MSSRQIVIIIPTYKEDIAVIQTTALDVSRAFSSTDWEFEIVVVNDGSGDAFDYAQLTDLPNLRVVEHAINKGYGAAIKTGIQHSSAPWIAITDADGTYPNHDFPKLLQHTDEADMVIGERRLTDVEPLRQFPKYVLNRYASFLAKEHVPDLNSGMRLFKRNMAKQFWNLYPDGFSLTSTITMAALGEGYQIKYEPIEYFKRKGKSSIHPIKDTYRFFKLVARLGLHFNPLRIFGPIAGVCVTIALLKGIRDYGMQGHIGNFSVSLFLAGLQIYFMGLLGELIIRRR